MYTGATQRYINTVIPGGIPDLGITLEQGFGGTTNELEEWRYWMGWDYSNAGCVFRHL